MQWANNVLIQNAMVANYWMIPKGTIGLGCHSIYSGSPYGCKSFYDNIKVGFCSYPCYNTMMTVSR